MFLKTLTIAALSATFLISVPQQEAQAGSTGKILGGLAAGAAAGYIAHKVHKHHKNKKRARRSYDNRQYSNTRSTKRRGATFSQATLDTQTRLNILGYDAGTPDGLSGRRTRQAIRQFQIANGRAVTGKLSNPEIALLHQQSANLLASRTVAPSNQFVSNAPVAGGVVVGGAAGAYGANAIQQQQQVAPQIQPIQPQQTARLLEPATPSVLSTAPYSTDADRPSILGINVRGSLSTTTATLKQEGFQNCEKFDHAVFCERETNFGSDKIAVGASGDEIHTISRKLSFNNPIPRSKVFGIMPASYSELINSRDNTVASSAACNALISAKPNTFDATVEQSVRGTNFDNSTVGFSQACNYYFAINMADTPSVSEVELTFFDSSPILAGLNGATTSAAASGATTGELKF